jgi:outer membrane protein TolC
MSIIRRHGATFISAVVLLWTGSAVAQDRPLSLQEALSETRRNNHDLAAARAMLEEARGDSERAFDALLPTVSASGLYTHNYRDVPYSSLFKAKDIPAQQAAALSSLTSSLGDISVLKGDALQGTLGVNVPLASAPAWFNLAAARANYRANEANNAVTETTVLYAAALTFYAAAGADELIDARTHAVEVARKTLLNAQASFQAGKATRLDIDRAQLASVNAEQALREAQDTRDAAYRSLATITGVRDGVRVAPVAPSGDAPPDTHALVERSFDLRPEFGAYRANIAASVEQSKSALWQWAPTLSGFGNANVFNYKGITGDEYSWAFGLQLSWTIFDGGIRDANRRQAEARRIENAERETALQSTIADDIVNASRAVGTKRQGVSSAERAASIAGEALDLVRIQYSAGTATQLDVLQAQDSLIAAEVQRAQARFDLALADLSLRRQSGTFPKDAHLE